MPKTCTFITNGGLSFNYNAYDLNNGDLPNTTCIDNSIGVIDCEDVVVTSYPPFNFNNSCPTTLVNGGFQDKVFQYRQRYVTRKDEVEQNMAVYDGGNSQNLVNFIANTTADWQIKNELLEHSPYLSDEVLITMLQKQSPKVGDWVIDQILEANAPVSDDVLKVAVNRADKLPDYIIRDAFNAATSLSKIASRMISQS